MATDWPQPWAPFNKSLPRCPNLSQRIATSAGRAAFLLRRQPWILIRYDGRLAAADRPLAGHARASSVRGNSYISLTAESVMWRRGKLVPHRVKNPRFPIDRRDRQKTGPFRDPAGRPYSHSGSANETPPLRHAQSTFLIP